MQGPRAAAGFKSSFDALGRLSGHQHDACFKSRGHMSQTQQQQCCCQHSWKVILSQARNTFEHVVQYESLPTAQRHAITYAGLSRSSLAVRVSMTRSLQCNAKEGQKSQYGYDRGSLVCFVGTGPLLMLRVVQGPWTVLSSPSVNVPIDNCILSLNGQCKKLITNTNSVAVYEVRPGLKVCTTIFKQQSSLLLFRPSHATMTIKKVTKLLPRS